jgi:hypothetical protein
VRDYWREEGILKEVETLRFRTLHLKPSVCSGRGVWKARCSLFIRKEHRRFVSSKAGVGLGSALSKPGLCVDESIESTV